MKEGRDYSHLAVAPHDPVGAEVGKADGQDQGRCDRIGKGDDIDDEDSPILPRGRRRRLTVETRQASDVG